MASLLFVDDEPGIRDTMPRILEMHGFTTTAASTVEEALKQITTSRFDILISDLNIGQPGDGFTVVSAMRRVQPDCRTFILTGFPALDSALKAIRAQVDDYLLKPANIEELVATLEASLKAPRNPKQNSGKGLSAILREREQVIVAKTLANVKADRRLGALPLSDSERIDHIPPMLRELAAMLDSGHPAEPVPQLLESARKRGELRFQQGYSVDMIITEARLLVRALNDVFHENLLDINLSNIMLDLKWLDESLGRQLEESVRSYVRAENQKAA